MYRWIICCSFLTFLSGCAVPISSSCMDSQAYEHPETSYPPKNSKCSSTDAAAYVIASTLNTLEDDDKKNKVDAKKPVKCSDMIGKAQKECARKEKELYDPLDEL